MRIAILGTRGIPANYGGFETFAEELSVRLVERGHSVTVYGRSNYIDRQHQVYRGVRLVVLPTIRHKYLDTPANTLFSSLHAMFKKYDVILYCNSANALFTLFPRLARHRVIINVDGLEWKRGKWNRFGQWVYKVSEWLSTVIPNWVVTDAKSIESYYKEKFNTESTWIPYGAPTGRLNSCEVLKKYQLESRKYILYVSRLEPENNAHVVIEAFEKVKTDMKLVIVGDAPYSTEYIQTLKRTTDSRIIFTGYVFGQGYREFQSHAYVYVQATEVGGTHPALLEAMGHGNCVIANRVPEHTEVLADTGYYFEAQRPETLVQKLQHLIDQPENVAKAREAAMNRVKAEFSWDHVTDEYERLFERLRRPQKGA